MKKFLFALLAVMAFVVAAPVAEAGQFARVYTRHGPVYLHKSQLYGGGNYYDNGYRYGNRRHRHHRSYRNYYDNCDSRPVYYSRSRSSYGYQRPYYYGRRSSPRVAISFGF